MTIRPPQRSSATASVHAVPRGHPSRDPARPPARARGGRTAADVRDRSRQFHRRQAEVTATARRSTLPTSWCWCRRRPTRSAWTRPGRVPAISSQLKGGRTSLASRRPIRTRPKRCRAATGLARVGRLPTLFLDEIRGFKAGRDRDDRAQPQRLPHREAARAKRGEGKPPARAPVQQTHVRHILLRAPTSPRRPTRSAASRNASCASMRASRLRQAGQPAFGGSERQPGRRPRLGLSGRHGARVRARDERAEAQRGERAGADAVRLAPDPGRSSAAPTSSRPTAKVAGAAGDPRAQGRRGLPGLAAAGARHAFVENRLDERG